MPKPKPRQYEEHPAADIYPPMPQEQYEEFKQNIAEQGCLQPIILFEGKLLDGRHRLKACQELGIRPPVISLGGAIDPIEYVDSHNGHRRHMTDSQRALSAAKSADLRKKSKAPNGARLSDAAERVNASARSVSRAAKVVEKASKQVVDAVASGEISIAAAEKLVDEVPDKREQIRIVSRGVEAVRAAVKRPRPGQNKPAPSQSQGVKPKESLSSKLGEFDRLWKTCSVDDKRAIRARILSEEF